MQLVEKQRRELGRSRGDGNFQLTLKMIEELKAKAAQTAAALEKVDGQQTKGDDKEVSKPERKPRTSSGPNEQPRLPIIEQEFVLDDADRACPSCGGEL